MNLLPDLGLSDKMTIRQIDLKKIHHYFIASLECNTKLVGDK